MESVNITEWLQQRIIEIDNTIELYENCCNSMNEIISINTSHFKSVNEVDDNEKESASKRLSIYRNVINDILIPTKNNHLHLLKSFIDMKSEAENINKQLKDLAHEHINKCKDSCYHNGRNAGNEAEGDYGTWRDWEARMLLFGRELLKNIQ